VARNDPKPDAGVGMKCTIERDSLLRALAHAAAVVERRNTIPILSNLLIDADGDKVTRDDGPVGASAEQMSRFELPAAQLRHLIDKTAFAQCTELTRFYLCGVHLVTMGGDLVAVATNGHCMAEAIVSAPEGAAEAPGVILSSKFVAELRKLIDGVDGLVDVGLSARKAEVGVGNSLLVGKVIEGQFPDWRRVIPSANDKKMLVQASSFSGAVKRAAVVANEKTRAVRLDLSRDKLTVSVSSPEYGTATEEAPAAYDAAELTIGFNSRYLLDTVAAIGGDEVQIEFGDAAAPTLFTNPSDTMARWVVMPMRV
jgi:DNA polymerase-3 subunit beta